MAGADGDWCRRDRDVDVLAQELPVSDDFSGPAPVRALGTFRGIVRGSALRYQHHDINIVILEQGESRLMDDGLV